MTTENIKSILGTLKPEDAKSVNAIKTIVNGELDSAETELKQTTNDSLKQIDTEYDEYILALLQERDARKQGVLTEQQEKADQIRKERDSQIVFFAVAKQLVESFDRSDKGLPVPVADCITSKLDILAKYDYDITDDETVALLFSEDVCGAANYKIETYADLETQIAKVDENNKDFSIKQTSELALPKFTAIADLPKTTLRDVAVNVTLSNKEGTESFVDVWQEESHNEDYYTALTSALAAFKGKLDAAVEKTGRSPAKVYGAFFKAAKSEGVDTGLKTKANFDAYEADLLAEAQKLDIQYITDLYNEIRTLPYDTANFEGKIQTNIVTIQDQIAEVSARYGLDKDAVITKAFAKQNITNEAELNKRLLTDSFEINIRGIVNGIRALSNKDAASTGETLAQVQTIDLSEKRLKAAGVSNDSIKTIVTLKSDFIDALSTGKPTSEIEKQLGTVAINAQSEMNSKHLKRTFA